MTKSKLRAPKQEMVLIHTVTATGENRVSAIEKAIDNLREELKAQHELRGELFVRPKVRNSADNPVRVISNPVRKKQAFEGNENFQVYMVYTLQTNDGDVKETYSSKDDENVGRASVRERAKELSKEHNADILIFEEYHQEDTLLGITRNESETSGKWEVEVMEIITGEALKKVLR